MSADVSNLINLANQLNPKVSDGDETFAEVKDTEARIFALGEQHQAEMGEMVALRAQMEAEILSLKEKKPVVQQVESPASPELELQVTQQVEEIASLKTELERQRTVGEEEKALLMVQIEVLRTEHAECGASLKKHIQEIAGLKAQLQSEGTNDDELKMLVEQYVQETAALKADLEREHGNNEEVKKLLASREKDIDAQIELTLQEAQAAQEAARGNLEAALAEKGTLAAEVKGCKQQVDGLLRKLATAEKVRDAQAHRLFWVLGVGLGEAGLLVEGTWVRMCMIMYAEHCACMHVHTAYVM